jgi:hypothetical protein
MLCCFKIIIESKFNNNHFKLFDVKNTLHIKGHRDIIKWTMRKHEILNRPSYRDFVELLYIHLFI